jgi:hypothetical protein
MAFLKRLKYYLIGVGIGSLMVFGMFGRRNDIQCAYFPEARTLKSIGEKELVASKKANCQYACAGYDSTTIKDLLIAGDVDFDKSETKNEGCHVYYISTESNGKEIVAYFENCDSTATIIKFDLPVTLSCDCN